MRDETLRQTQLVCLWPSCNTKLFRSQVKELLGSYGFSVAAQSDLLFTFPEFNQFVYDAYQGEPWTVRRNRPCCRGILRKASWCYIKGSPLTLLSVTGGTPDALQELKEAARTRAGLGKHSIHTIDNSEAADRILRTYTTGSPCFDFAAALSHSASWRVLRLYTSLKTAIFRGLGHVEQ